MICVTLGTDPTNVDYLPREPVKAEFRNERYIIYVMFWILTVRYISQSLPPKMINAPNTTLQCGPQSISSLFWII